MKKVKNEYINIWDYASKLYPFQIFVGGRGTGKTYSALKGCITGQVPEGSKFVYLRRTQNEIDMCITGSVEDGNPFATINRNEHTLVGMEPIKKQLAGIYQMYNDDDKYVAAGAPIGYGMALSTIANLRGMDFSNVSHIIYDEFIPEKHVRKIKGECDALLNAYETMCRNRELEGLPPIYMYLLANSNDIYNPIFQGLGVVNDVEKMMSKNVHDKYYRTRGLAIHLLENSESFVQKKRQTALYRLTQNTKFSKMSLDNSFAYNDFSLVKYKDINGYQPVCALDDMTLYKKKGSKEYHWSYAPAQVQKYNSSIDQDRRAFCKNIGLELVKYFVSGTMTFESYEIKAIILEVIL